MNISCSAEPCPVILDCSCVFYSGANLIYTGIVTNDTLCTSLAKIDQKFKDAAIGYVFQNGIIQAVPGGPVKLGGTLNQNTTITSGGYTFALTGTIESSAFITTGGTSSQFVKGDGSLDSTSYQPAGNYISALTGDGTATGPGSVPFTLATTGVLPNTYGSSTDIPILTIDSKGRITWATSVPFAVPPALLLFSGDVTGVGYSNTTIPLTLATVLSTPGTYGSTTTIPVVTVNAKGLVTGISQVSFPAGTGTVTAVTATSPLASTGGATPDISIQQASGSQAGYLSSTDWTTFNGKQDVISLTTTGTSGAATFAANTLNIPQYQAALTNPVTGTGTATRVAFWDSSSSISSDADLYWDNTNKRLGIGDQPYGYKLSVLDSNNYARFGTTAGSDVNAVILGKSTSSAIALMGGGGERKILIGDGATGYANFIAYSGNIMQFGYSNATGGPQLPSSLTLFTPNFIYSTGTNTHTINDVLPVINLTGGTNTLRGYYYHPNVISGSASPNTHIAFENTIGDIIHGNLAGGGTQMVTVDNTGKLGATTIPTGGGGLLHGIAAGTDTYTVTIAGAPTSYSEGDAYIIRFTNGNTTSATLNINSIGAVPLYRNNDGVLIGGDITAGGDMLCVYDTSIPAFRVIGTSPNMLFSYVTNDDSVTITKGQVVYAFGGQGDRMTVKLASNVGDATSAQTVGLVVSTSIAANQKGLIMIQGLLDGLSILPTATWNDGDPVYLGATPGSITKVKPYAPAHLVYIGTVTTASNGSAGRMYVKIQNGYELDELHNVQAQSPTYKDTLWYDNTVSPAQWKTASISTILGYTPQAALTLTTTGTSGAATLIANTLNIPQYAGATVGGVAGNIQYNDGTTFAGSNDLFWDSTFKYLGIGTNFPGYLVDAQGNVNSDQGIQIRNNNSGSFATTGILLTNDGSGYLETMLNSSTYSGGARFGINAEAVTIAGSVITVLGTVNTSALIFGTNNSERIRIFGSTGNVGVNTATDAGYKLDVNGTARAVTSLQTPTLLGNTTSGGTLTLQSTSNATKGKILFGTSAYDEVNNRLGIGTTSPTSLIQSTGSITASSANAKGVNLTSTLVAAANNDTLTGLDVNTNFTNGAFTGVNNYMQKWSMNGVVRSFMRVFGQTWLVGDGTTEAGLIGYSTPSGFPGIVTQTYSAGSYVNRFDLINRGSSFRLGFDASNGGLGNLSIFNTGNVVISTSGTTDAGYKLDVNGTTRLNGNVGVNTVVSGVWTLDVGGSIRSNSNIALSTTSGVLGSAGQIQSVRGTNTTQIAYRTTNAGSNVSPNPNIVFGASSGTGGLRLIYDETNQLMFSAINASSINIPRASIQVTNLTNTAGAESGDMIFLTQSGGTAISEKMRITGAGGLTINATNTASGTTGNQTINKASGTVNIAAAGTTVTVTNSLVSATSIVYAVIRTNDATATIKNVVPSAGSFVINLDAAATAEVSIGFFVIN